MRRSAETDFDVLQLERLFCQPNAYNVAPNRTLQRAGFRYLCSYETTPSPINFQLPVTLWVLEPQALEARVDSGARADPTALWEGGAVRGRRPADEELLPLEVDGDDARPDGQLVELGRPRRRWRDAAVVLAVVALVAGFGLLGDGDEDDEDDEAVAEAEPTTSSSVVRRRPTPTRPRVTTTTMPPGVPTVEPGTGPLLGEATGSAVAFSHGDGGVTVIDLDTGSRCRVTVPGREAGWLNRSAGALAIVQGERTHAVDADCTVTPLPGWRGGEVFPTDVLGRYWAVEWRPDGMFLSEVDAEGVKLGPGIASPQASGMIRKVDGGIVVDVFGSVTFVAEGTHDDRHLAHGMTLAARGDRVAISECEGLSCDVVVRDLGGRAVARVAGLRPVGAWEGGALSHDGRRLAVLVGEDGATIPSLVVIDLESGRRHEVLRSEGGPIAFTATGRHIVIARPNAGLVAAPVEGGDPILIEQTAFQGFAVVDRPAA